MCEPATIALVMAGVAVAGSAASAVGQYQQASATNKAAGKAAQIQADEFASSRDETINERVRNARMERARLRVAGGESGVAGNSFDMALQDSFGRENQDIAVIRKQGGFTERALNAELTSVGARNKFSPVAAGLQIAGAGASAYTEAGGKFGKKPSRAPSWINTMDLGG